MIPALHLGSYRHSSMPPMSIASDLWEGPWLARQHVFMDWTPDKSPQQRDSADAAYHTQGMQSTCSLFLKKPFTQKSAPSWGSLELRFHPGTRTMYLLHMVTPIGAMFVDHLPTEVQELVTSKSFTSYLLPSLSKI